MISIGRIHRIDESADQLKRWRCGRIVMADGRLVEVQRHLLGGSVSVAQVWWQTHFRALPVDHCTLDYHQPFGARGFLTLDYIHSGVACQYKTFVGAIRILEEIARIRRTLAIVAHVSTRAISDRLLVRLGWERHQEQWSGRHWIRRFYDGYPPSALKRYQAAPRCPV